MTNVANKDEALRCLEIATQALKDADFNKAQRFATKARKLCDCAEVKAFLAELSTKSSNNGAASEGPSTSTGTSTGNVLRQRNGRTSNSANSATSQPSRPAHTATREQEEVVARILKQKSFYDILGIAKDADEEEIKKAYKKLALKLHPDKNKAPKAEEAFKAVSRAFSCLSDPEKRSNYDRYGHEDRAQAAAAAAANGGYGMHGFNGEDMDPFEIFNSFFTPSRGVFHPFHHSRVFRTHYRTGPRRARGDAGDQSMNFMGLVHVLPLIVLFMYTFFSGPSEAAYKMSRDGAFTELMKTKKFAVPFYVKSRSKFEKAYPTGSYYRTQLELQINATYRDWLERSCRDERLRRKRIKQSLGEEQAQKVVLTHCTELKEKFRGAVMY